MFLINNACDLEEIRFAGRAAPASQTTQCQPSADRAAPASLRRTSCTQITQYQALPDRLNHAL